MTDQKPTLTLIIEQGEFKSEFTLGEDLFDSFDEACEALKQFFESNRR